MKKSIALLALAVAAIVVLDSCSSGKGALEHGNYYSAVITSVNHLRRNPGHKKSSETLRNAYPLALRYHEDQANAAAASTKEFKWREVVVQYNTLQSMYDEIQRSPGALQVIPNPTNFSTKLAEARQKAAEESYVAGVLSMGKGDRNNAKNAYYLFVNCNEYVAGYKDVLKLMEQARMAATVKVAVEPLPAPSRNFGADAQYFDNKLNEYLRSHPANDFVKFYTVADARSQKIIPDHVVQLAFDEFAIGQVYMNEKESVAVRDSVIVAYTYTDTKGAMKRDETEAAKIVPVVGAAAAGDKGQFTTVGGDDKNVGQEKKAENEIKNEEKKEDKVVGQEKKAENEIKNEEKKEDKVVGQEKKAENEVKNEQKKEDKVTGQEKKAENEIKNEEKKEDKEVKKEEKQEDKNVKQEEKKEDKDVKKEEKQEDKGVKQEEKKEDKDVKSEEKKEDKKDDKDKGNGNGGGAVVVGAGAAGAAAAGSDGKKDKEEKKDGDGKKEGDDKKDETKVEDKSGEEQVTICHQPPGNASERKTMTIPKSALKGHLGHGDVEGECKNDKKDDKGKKNGNEDAMASALTGRAPVLLASASNDLWYLFDEEFPMDTTKVYAKVKATVHHYRKTISSRGILNLRIIDAKTKAVISEQRMPTETVWASEWLTYNGDSRALTADQENLARKKELPPPTQQDLFAELTKPLLDQVTKRISEFYKNY